MVDSHGGIIPLNDDTLALLTTLGRTAKTGLHRLLEHAGQVQEVPMNERLMELPATTGPSKINPTLPLSPTRPRKGTLSIAAITIHEKLKRYAIGTHALTFHDIHGLGKSLHELGEMLNRISQELKYFRIILEDMEGKGLSHANLDGFFKLFNFDDKVLAFRTIQKTLDQVMNIFLWRMKTVNRPANELFIIDIDQDSLLEIFTRVVRPMRNRLKGIIMHGDTPPEGALELEELTQRMYSIVDRVKIE